MPRIFLRLCSRLLPLVTLGILFYLTLSQFQHPLDALHIGRRNLTPGPQTSLSLRGFLGQDMAGVAAPLLDLARSGHFKAFRRRSFGFQFHLLLFSPEKTKRPPPLGRGRLYPVLRF